MAEIDPDWQVARSSLWGDEGWWQAQIDRATAGPGPVICNLRITLAHQELSLALRRITGPESGPNFHTWAVWGSKKAGQTIRREELPFLPRTGAVLGTVLGASAGAGAARTRDGVRVGAALAGGAAGGASLYWTAQTLLAAASRHIFSGNVTVLADIGRQTARFVSLFWDLDRRTPDRLEEFLSGLRPGPAASGGQELLGGAYRHYYAASVETSADRRDECMLYANLLAILHEHRRLDPYIDASVPWPLRRLVTSYLLSFTVGAETLRVSDDVRALGPMVYPDTLRTIELPELESLLAGPHGWDRTPNSVTGSRAHDWTELSDRMNFIVDLFRTRQSDPNLFTSPYSPEQRDAILTGSVPGGAL